MDNASRNSVWNEFKLNKAFGSLIQRGIFRGAMERLCYKKCFFFLG